MRLPQIESLLAALRHEGLAVGVPEALRLRAVLSAAAPVLRDEAELRAVLASVLLRAPEGRPSLERAVDAWLAAAAIDLGPADDAAARMASPAGLSAGQQRSSLRRLVQILRQQRRAVGAVLGALLLTLGIAAVLISRPPPVLLQSVPDLGPPELGLSVDDGAAEQTVDLRALDAAEVAPPPRPPSPKEDPDSPPSPPPVEKQPAGLQPAVVPPSPPDAGWPLSLWLSAAALLLGAGLWLGLGRRSLVPGAVPLPVGAGPERILPAEDGGARTRYLLEPRQEEVLVWGIGHFVSGEPTRHLDVQRSVIVTADAGGRPELRFLRARHSREVWLWVDDAAAGGRHGALLQRLAAEIEAALTQAGLPVEVAHYLGVPERLHQDGAALAPVDLEERRGGAVVVLLTDGRILERRLGDPRTRERTEQLLRLLGGWPRLAFVDFARGVHRLEELLVRHEIPVLRPEEVAGFLGSEAGLLRREQEGPAELCGDALAWAAALSLSPFPVDEASALRLRQELGLAVSPYALEALRERSGGGRLTFGRAERIRWQRWLDGQLSVRPLRKRLRGSVAQGALSFWLHRVEEALRRGEGAAALRLRLYGALLRLWGEPAAAALELHRLRGALPEEVRDALGQRGPRGCGDLVLPLPWRLEELPLGTRVLLLDLGLGRDAGLRPLSARRSGRLGLGLGLCAGLVVGALGWAGLRWWWPRPVEVPRSVDLAQAGPEDLARVGEEDLAQAGPEDLAQREDLARPQPLLTVRFQAPAGVTVICGGKNGRGNWVAVLAPKDICRATALGYQDKYYSYRYLEQLGNRPVQITLSQKTDMASPAPVDMAQPPPDLARPPDLAQPSPGLVQAGPNRCHNQEATYGGMVFVRVCDNIFTMGDNYGASDETPVHKVHVSEFWMGKYEVSRREYRPFGVRQDPDMWKLKMLDTGSGVRPDPDVIKADDKPAANVSWFDAKAFCESQGFRLPTEAEWEYAARGTDSRQYPWGPAEPNQTLAVYNQHQPDAVQSHEKGKGPFGTLNQAGNVWEWVEDCYDSTFYNNSLGKEVTDNPLNDNCQKNDKPSSSVSRVLRGGSFDLGPGDLRSAFRFRFEPGFRIRNIGFRCVRGPRRQP